jgi:hypothetical protein
MEGTDIPIVPFRLDLDYINDYNSYVDRQPTVDASNLQQLERLDSTIKKLTIRGSRTQPPLNIPASIKRFSNLEELYIKDCYVDNIEPVVHLSKLKKLHFRYSWLNIYTTPPDFNKLTSLRSLEIGINYKGESIPFPEQILKLENLVHLNVSFYKKNTIKGFSQLKKLQSLTIEGNYSEIDSSICDLPELKELILFGNQEHFTLPLNITKLNKSLIKLRTVINSQTDADLIKKLDQLKYLELFLSKPAIKISLNPALIDLFIEDRSGVLPVDFTNVPNLQLLQISYSGINRFPRSLTGLTNLRSLVFRYFENLENFDDSMFNNKKCKDIRLYSCPKLKLSETARAKADTWHVGN